MATGLKPVPDQRRIERKTRVESAIASVRMEGLEPTPSALAVFDRYVRGELTEAEMTAKIRALSAAEFGPVHVSGD